MCQSTLHNKQVCDASEYAKIAGSIVVVISGECQVVGEKKLSRDIRDMDGKRKENDEKRECSRGSMCVWIFTEYIN